MLQILNITRPQFTPSNISRVRMNAAYPSTQSPLQKYKHLTISHIITIKSHTQKWRRLLHQNATNSQPSVTPNINVNFLVRSKKVLLWNCSNFALSSFLICWSGSPISWKSIVQNQTDLSSCEAKILATKECTTPIIPEAYVRTKIYSYNKAAVQCAASVTSKFTKKWNLR